MKKRAVIALLVLVILFIPLINAFSFNDFWNKIIGKAIYSTGNECTDTDRINYPDISQENIKGNIYGKEWIWSFNYTDLCMTDSILREYYCASTGEASARQYTCSEGCENGACKQSATSQAACGNECSPNGARYCTGTYTYNICGNYDSDSCYELSSESTCPSGQSCNSATGNCTGTSSCTSECTYGSKTCSGSGYKTCGNYDSDSCYEWSSVTNCASGQTCSNGQCASSCNNECTYGSIQCAGVTGTDGAMGYKKCGNYDSSDTCYEWSNSVYSCDSGYTCSEGACVLLSCSNECSPSGTKQCSGNGYQTCGNYDSDSCYEWSSATNCASGETCSEGSCVAETCSVCSTSSALKSSSLGGGTATSSASDSCPIPLAAPNSVCQSSYDNGGSCTLKNSLNQDVEGVCYEKNCYAIDACTTPAAKTSPPITRKGNNIKSIGTAATKAASKLANMNDPVCTQGYYLGENTKVITSDIKTLNPSSFCNDTGYSCSDSMQFITEGNICAESPFEWRVCASIDAVRLFEKSENKCKITEGCNPQYCKEVIELTSDNRFYKMSDDKWHDAATFDYTVKCISKNKKEGDKYSVSVVMERRKYCRKAS